MSAQMYLKIIGSKFTYKDKKLSLELSSVFDLLINNQYFNNGGNDEARLGFAPRSQSFAFKPYGLAGSICSLSGLTHFRSCRPSANPPNSQLALLAAIILPLKKATQGGFF